MTIGDRITITVTAKQKFEQQQACRVRLRVHQPGGPRWCAARREVLAPLEKVSRLQEVHMPEIRIDDKHERYTHLLERVKAWSRFPTAVAHPAMPNR